LRKIGVISYWTRFSILSTRSAHYIQAKPEI